MADGGSIFRLYFNLAAVQDNERVERCLYRIVNTARGIGSSADKLKLESLGSFAVISSVFAGKLRLCFFPEGGGFAVCDNLNAGNCAIVVYTNENDHACGVALNRRFNYVTDVKFSNSLNRRREFARVYGYILFCGYVETLKNLYLCRVGFFKHLLFNFL